VELLGEIPQSSQSYLAQLDLLLELGEQSFDFIANSLRALVIRRICQRANCLWRWLPPVNIQLPSRCRSAKLLLLAALALLLCRVVDLVQTLALQTAIAQWFSFRAVVGIFPWLVAEMLSREAPLGLVAAIDNGNVRLKVTR
jgi:hypothetical protein